RFAFRTTDDRCDQPAGQGYGNADIGMLVLEHAAFGPTHVRIRNSLECERESLDDEVVDRKLVRGLAVLVLGRSRIDLLACRQELADIAIYCQVKMRNRLNRSRQALSDRASHAIVRHERVRVWLIKR